MTSTVPARPAAYVRVTRADSLDDQVVQQQHATVLRAAATLGWPEPAVYADIGTTGYNPPGSALATLTDDIQAGRRDAVITADLARISRTTSHLGGFTALCASHGVTLHTLGQGPIDPATAALIAGIS
jgi:DNA invertase Pin-like site-specific DNA recombinase